MLVIGVELDEDVTIIDTKTGDKYSFRITLKGLNKFRVVFNIPKNIQVIREGAKKVYVPKISS